MARPAKESGYISELEQAVSHKEKIMKRFKQPPEPVHVGGIHKGEEYVLRMGREAGRGCPGEYRSARDATSINPDKHGPIHPAMPSLPPA